MKITVSGTEATKRKIQAEIAREVEKQKKKIMYSLIDNLKEATPVDTGHARDSWKVVDNELVNDADYIDNLNNGSSKQAPTHFIESTVLQNPAVKPNGVVVRHSNPLSD